MESLPKSTLGTGVIDFGPHGSFPLPTREARFFDYRPPERESGINPDYARRRRQVLRRRAFHDGHERALWILWVEAHHNGKTLHVPPQCRAAVRRFESIWPGLQRAHMSAMERPEEEAAV